MLHATGQGSQKGAKKFHILFESLFKLRCDERFTHAFTAWSCFFKVITLVWDNQGNYFENAIACSKRTLKTTVATQLYFTKRNALQ